MKVTRLLGNVFIIFGLILIAAGLAHCQQLTPAYSSQRVDALAHAIGRAEGYGVKGAKPTRFRNPGDLKQDGEYRHFRTEAAGWQALRDQIVRIIAGQSHQYTLQMTIAQMGRRYAGSPLWAANVAKRLHIAPGTKLEAWLCEGDLDVAPEVQFQF